MRKAFIILAVAMLLLTSVLAACGEGGESSSESQQSDVFQASSQPVSEQSNSEDSTPEDSKGENSQPEDNSQQDNSKTESGNTENSRPDESSTAPDNQNGIKVLYCSYSEKPYFAMVGTCADGASITAKANGTEVTSLSYHGWFSIRLKCTGASVDVTLSQTVGGTTSDELQYNAKPVTPGSEMWGIVTGYDTQFFFQKMLPDFSCTNLPAQSSLTALTARLQDRISTLKRTSPDTEIIYMIVPSSMTVYPELVPEEYTKGTSKSRLDLVTEAIKAGGATVIDLRNAFQQHKYDEKPLYYKFDSHWSDYGAFVAYTELFNHISKKYPDTKPRSESEFDWNEGYYDTGDMTYYLSMSQTGVKEYSYYRTPEFDMAAGIRGIPRYRSATSLVYSDGVTRKATLNSGNADRPSCMVLRDSYSTQMYDILAERMSTTQYMGMWDYNWYEAEIQKSKPDYVIYIIAEWNIDSVLYK